MVILHGFVTNFEFISIKSESLSPIVAVISGFSSMWGKVYICIMKIEWSIKNVLHFLKGKG